MAFATTLRACAVAGCPGCTVLPSQHRATGEAALRTCVGTAMMPCSKSEIPLRFFAASAKADCNQVADTSRPCRKSTTPPVWSRALVPLSRFIAVAGVMASFWRPAVNIIDKRKAMSIPPVWRLAFRPFFLAGSLYALVAVPLWLLAFFGALPDWQPTGGWLAWHRHEMLFGFAVAI